jgi:hypothetical protein
MHLRHPRARRMPAFPVDLFRCANLSSAAADTTQVACAMSPTTSCRVSPDPSFCLPNRKIEGALCVRVDDANGNARCASHAKLSPVKYMHQARADQSEVMFMYEDQSPARACGATGWIWQRQTAIEEQVHRLVCSERRRSRRGARFFGAQCSQVRRRHPVIDSYTALTEAPRGWFVHDETRATAGT